MKIKKIVSKIKPPCSKCPYKLGLVRTFANPCPSCKENDYKTFEEFKKHSGDYSVSLDIREG